jgi:hypothetical protein
MANRRPSGGSKSRFEQIADEPGIGMNNDGTLNVVGFDESYAPGGENYQGADGSESSNPPQAADGVARPISRLHIPMRRPEDVKPFLGSPSHYVEGRSAYCLANSWMAENGLPELVRLTLETSPALQRPVLLEGFFEREVELGDRGRHSQTDLLALLGVDGTLVVMSVEGKVDEAFGKLVEKEMSNPTPLKAARVRRLAQELGLSLEQAMPLRYQLIHRTAAAISEARRFHSSTAVMMVHSFDARDSGFGDYGRFAEALGFGGIEPTVTIGPKLIGGINLFLGWTADRPSNEGFSIVGRRKTDEGFFDE